MTEEQAKIPEETKKEEPTKSEEEKKEPELNQSKLSTNLERENERDVIKGINDIKDISTPSLTSKYLQLSEMNNKMVKEREVLFHKDFLLLRNKFENEYNKVYQTTASIINAKEDASIPELTDEDYTKYNIQKNAENKPIDNFWVTTIDNSNYFTLNENDKKILAYLEDIQITPYENSLVNYKVDFIFKQNEFLEQTVIGKIYKYSEEEDKLLEVISDMPKWKKDEFNPTKKTVTKKIKKKKAIETSTVIKKVKSFFNIFEETKDLDKCDAEAKFFKADLLPNVLEYYLGIFEKEEWCDSDEEDAINEKLGPKKEKKKNKKSI